jgi:transposase
MTKTQVEVITSVQRRRRWSRAEKERIVAAALEPGAVASEVARAAGIHTSQLFRWRQELCRSSQSAAESAPTFSAVMIAPAAPALSELAATPTPALPAPSVGSVVEIEFTSGTRMRISGAVDPATVSAMIAALTNTKRRRR